MSDLISRSELLKAFNDKNIKIQITFDLPIEEVLGEDVDLDNFATLVQDAIQAYKKMVIDTIKNMPTAYSVDSVSDDVCEWKFEETNGIAWHCDDKCTTYNQVYIKDLKITLEDFECKCPYCGKKIKVGGVE